VKGSYPGFTRPAIEIIRRYEEHGWTFTVSSKNHAIGKSPDGVSTTSIARRLTTGNRSYQNALSTLNRWERAQVVPVPDESDSGPGPRDRRSG